MGVCGHCTTFAISFTVCADPQNQLRFTASADNTLAYIDVLYEERTEAPVPIGQPRTPMLLLLAGAGTYTNPYYIGTGDASGLCVLG